jgi:hypothetical protein
MCKLFTEFVEIIANFSGAISSLCFNYPLYLFARILNAPRLGLPEFLSNGSSMNWALKL